MSEKKKVLSDRIFAIITIVYLVSCVIIWVVADSSRRASYVEPLPLETADDGEAIPDSQKININTATAEELMTVNGIGEVTAAAVIEYREKNGDFLDVDELCEVRGIGRKTLEKIRPFLKT